MISELSRYSATKSDAAVMDTTRSITVINQQDIFGFDDTFMYSAAVTDQSYTFESRADSVFIKGFKATQYRLASNPYSVITRMLDHIFTLWNKLKFLKAHPRCFIVRKNPVV